MGVSVVLAAALLALCPQITWRSLARSRGGRKHRRLPAHCFIGIPLSPRPQHHSRPSFAGLGDSRSPMYVIGVACIINIALDFLFIGHMGLGPVGAALGTVTAQTASVALSRS